MLKFDILLNALASIHYRWVALNIFFIYFITAIDMFFKVSLSSVFFSKQILVNRQLVLIPLNSFKMTT